MLDMSWSKILPMTDGLKDLKAFCCFGYHRRTGKVFIDRGTRV